MAHCAVLSVKFAVGSVDFKIRCLTSHLPTQHNPAYSLFSRQLMVHFDVFSWRDNFHQISDSQSIFNIFERLNIWIKRVFNPPIFSALCGGGSLSNVPVLKALGCLTRMEWANVGKCTSSNPVIDMEFYKIKILYPSPVRIKYPLKIHGYQHYNGKYPEPLCELL